MNWSLLLLLACPLMMLFCMKGMFTGGKHSKNADVQDRTELESLQIKMTELMEQNHKLTQEIESVKKLSGESTNVVELRKVQNG